MIRNDTDSFDALTPVIDKTFIQSPLFSGIICLQSSSKEHVLIKGYQDYSTHTPIVAETKFQIASLTKQFTATALLLAFEHNNDPLDEVLKKPLSYFMPHFKASWASTVTLHSLLTHTSGVENYTDFDDHIGIYQGKNIRKNMMNHLATLIQKEEDKGIFRYCNTGYYLLDCVIKKLTGMNASDFMHHVIFEPLKMKDTSLPHSSTVDQLIHKKRLSHMARGYAVDMFASTFRSYEIPWYFPFEGCATDGGMVSTAPDLVKWTHDLCRDNIIIPKHIADRILKMHIINKKDAPTTWGYGYGIGVCQHETPKLNQYRHTGLVYGYTSVLAYFPHVDLVVVSLSNCVEDFFKRTSLKRSIREKLLHISCEEEREDLLNQQLDESYPHRLEWIDHLYPSLIPEVERFLEHSIQ